MASKGVVSLSARVKESVQWFSYISGMSAARAKRQRAMQIIMFHGVGGDDYPVPVFEAQLRYLKKHFSIVSLEPIVEKVAGRGSVESHEIALTFDDGLHNHCALVYPVLKRLNIPATFFVCPGLVESGQWLWNHEVRERLRMLSGERRVSLSHRVQAPGSGVEEILGWMKSLEPKQRKSVEEAVRTAVPDFRPSAQQHQQYDVMTWRELASFDPALVTIGSHSVSHPILTTLNPAELAYEIRGSRRWLEERLQRPIEHFCYPNGAGNAAVLHCVRECYRSAVTSEKGGVQTEDDVCRLKRIPTARQLPSLAWRLHWPTGRESPSVHAFDDGF